MGIKTLDAKSYTTVLTYVPRNRRVKYKVEAERPVSAFLIDKEDFDRYDDGEKVRSYGGASRKRFHVQRGKLPYSGEWMLVISNENDRPVAIHYDVS